MTIIQRSALVRYSANQMFALVNDIADYPRFLPWCKASHILQETEDEIVAALDVAWSGIHKSFTTKNQLHPHDRIEITLVKGPFRYLQGTWRFIDMGQNSCKVNLELEFELTGHLFDRLFEPIFHHMANSLVDLFCKRAAEVYGTDNS
jgi:ribosome-associated toxin RatA of RatAB toxin-antitoxin module